MATVTVTENTSVGTLVEILDSDKFAVSRDGNILTISDVTQEELDSAWTTYNSDLEAHEISPVRATRKDKISQAAADFISETYPSFRRELFIALAEEARDSGLVNRVAYINQLLTWVKTVVAETIVSGDEIDVETDLQTINDYVVDFSQFDATNPNITIKAALAIAD